LSSRKIGCSRGGTVFSISDVSVKRDVSTVAEFLGAASRPIDRRIQNVGPGVGIPLDPCMSLGTERHAFSDDETNVLCTVQAHPLVKRDRFSFAIGEGLRIHFCRRFPFLTIAVGNRPQLFDPVVYENQRKVLPGDIALAKKRGGDSGHLFVIRSAINIESTRPRVSRPIRRMTSRGRPVRVGIRIARSGIQLSWCAISVEPAACEQ
jgi:hypothetical protein